MIARPTGASLPATVPLRTPRIQNPIRRPWRRHSAPWLLGASLALNVAALRLPFMDVRRVFSTDEYGLASTVELLWESGLYVLAIVVVAFSIVFPFTKLAVMAAIVLGLAPVRAQRGLLAFVERYGKWSMLDVFLVALMIALAGDQLLIGATARHGILCFTLAIVLSMICSGRMVARLRRPPRPAQPPDRPPRLLVLGQVVLLALLCVALSVPFLEIDDWRLSDRPVSIVAAVAGLWETGARTLAVVVALFLAVVPVAAGLLALFLLLRIDRLAAPERWRRALAALRHWEMLDVFALALGIFLVEGRAFVSTELSWGAFLIALLLALYWPATLLQDRRLAS